MQKSLRIISCFITILIFDLHSQDTGQASYYSKRLEGHKTSDKSRYHADSLTCAHRTYPLGSYLKVKNLKNDKQVIVKVTDRGPRPRRLIIDVSYRAAKILDFIRAGTAPVEVTALDSLSLLTAIKDTAMNMASDSLRNDTLSMAPLVKLQLETHHRCGHRKHHVSIKKHKNSKHSRRRNRH